MNERKYGQLAPLRGARRRVEDQLLVSFGGHISGETVVSINHAPSWRMCVSICWSVMVVDHDGERPPVLLKMIKHGGVARLDAYADETYGLPAPVHIQFEVHAGVQFELVFSSRDPQQILGYLVTVPVPSRRRRRRSGKALGH